jgi:cytochrome c-type biogenesis protein
VPDPGTGLVAFGAGLLSFFAPCVLPVIPGYVAFVTGGTASSVKRRLGLTLAFVSGFSLAFVAIGLLIGLVGTTEAFRSAETWLQRVGGTVIILFGLHMTGLLTLSFLQREVRYQGQAPDQLGPVTGAAFLGAAFGVGWSPCVGPVLASILVLAGLEGGALAGGLLLTAYAAGLAIPFLILGVTADRGAAWLRDHQRIAQGVEIVGGTLLIVLGIFVFTGSLAQVLSYVVPRNPL